MATTITNYANIVNIDDGESISINKRNYVGTDTPRANTVVVKYFQPNDNQQSTKSITVNDISKPTGLDTPNKVKNYLDFIFGTIIQSNFLNDKVLLSDGAGGIRSDSDLEYDTPTETLKTINVQHQYGKNSLSGAYWDFGLPAASWTPTNTNGCETATFETSGNNINSDVLDFDPSSKENAQISFKLPDMWDGGQIKAKIYWQSTGSATSGETARFLLKATSSGDDDALDSSFENAVFVEDEVLDTEDTQETAATDVIPLPDGITSDSWITLNLARDAGNANDNMGGDARVLNVQIQFKLGNPINTQW